MAERKPYDRRGTPKVLNNLANVDPGDLAREFFKSQADLRVQLTPDRAETILMLVSTGMFVSDAARECGINPGLVNQRAYDDPVFKERLKRAREIAAPTIFEAMAKVAWNDAEDPRRSKLKMETLEKMAKVYDRATFGDQVKVDATVGPAPVILAPLPTQHLLPASLKPQEDDLEGE